VKPSFQKIRKEKGSEDGKKDEKLDKYYNPKLFTDGHASESVIVKIKDPFNQRTRQ